MQHRGPETRRTAYGNLDHGLAGILDAHASGTTSRVLLEPWNTIREEGPRSGIVGLSIGACYMAHETRAFGGAAGLVIRNTPAYSPKSNGMAECFAKGFKRNGSLSRSTEMKPQPASLS